MIFSGKKREIKPLLIYCNYVSRKANRQIKLLVTKGANEYNIVPESPRYKKQRRLQVLHQPHMSLIQHINSVTERKYTTINTFSTNGNDSWC